MQLTKKSLQHHNLHKNQYIHHNTNHLISDTHGSPFQASKDNGRTFLNTEQSTGLQPQCETTELVSQSPKPETLLQQSEIHRPEPWTSLDPKLELAYSYYHKKRSNGNLHGHARVEVRQVLLHRVHGVDLSRG